MATRGKIERDLRILVRDKFTCVYCRYVADTFEKWRYLTVDHFNPRANEEARPTKIFVTACVDCNGIKSDEVFPTLEEARAKMSVYLAKERADYDKHFAALVEAANSERETLRESPKMKERGPIA